MAAPSADLLRALSGLQASIASSQNSRDLLDRLWVPAAALRQYTVKGLATREGTECRSPAMLRSSAAALAEVPAAKHAHSKSPSSTAFLARRAPKSSTLARRTNLGSRGAAGSARDPRKRATG